MKKPRTTPARARRQALREAVLGPLRFVLDTLSTYEDDGSITFTDYLDCGHDLPGHPSDITLKARRCPKCKPKSHWTHLLADD